MAKYIEDEEVISLLMRAAKTNKSCIENLPALEEIEATSPGRLAAIRIDRPKEGANNVNILHLAALKNNSAMTLFALEILKIDVDIRDHYNQTPLLAATGLGGIEVIKTLLECKANVNSQYEPGYSSLYTAVELHFPKIARLLLENGADVNKPFSSTETPFIYGTHSMMNQSSELLQLLFEYKADVNYKTQDGKSALGLVASHGDFPETCSIEIVGSKFLMSLPVSLEVNHDKEAQCIYKTLVRYPCFVPQQHYAFAEGIDEKQIQKINIIIKHNEVERARAAGHFNHELSGLFDAPPLVKNVLLSLFDLSEITLENIRALTIEDVSALGVGSEEPPSYAAAVGHC